MNNNDIITQSINNIQEVIGLDEFKLLVDNKDTHIPHIYWGTAPTGKIHIGYFLSLMKIADFVNLGFKVTILIADIHSLLDDKKFDKQLLEHRIQYYIDTLTCILNSLNVDANQIIFVRGSSFQKSEDYVSDLLSLSNLTSIKTALHSGSQVTKQSKDPVLSSLLYPLLQSLDEVYLNADIQLGGTDQRKIFSYSRDNISKLMNVNTDKIYKKCIYFMTPMLEKLSTTSKTDWSVNDIDNKMSASDETGKIDVLDTFDIIKRKINKVYCVDGNVDDNSLLSLVKLIIFPVLKLKNIEFKIPRPVKYGGEIIISDYDDLSNKFFSREIYSVDLKLGVVYNLDLILQPIRNTVNSDLVKAAYN